MAKPCLQRKPGPQSAPEIEHSTRWQTRLNLEVSLLLMGLGGGQQWVERFKRLCERGWTRQAASYIHQESHEREADFTYDQVRVRQMPDALPWNLVSPAFPAIHATEGNSWQEAVSGSKDTHWAFPSSIAKQLDGISGQMGYSTQSMIP